MASKRELEALIVLAGKIDPSLQNALKKAQGETTKTSSSMQKLTQVSNKYVNGIIKSAVAVGVGVAAGLAVVAKEGIQLASDLAEVQNVVDVAFGQSSGEINDWAQAAKNSYGLSELHAKKFTGTMGAMLKSSKVSGQALITMSEDLTGLAGDFASFYNLDPEEAFNKIRAGISGETEPLKQLGINMSVTNLEAYALSKGIKTSYQKMDQASQSALRYAYLMEVSKDAQGDFNRTQGSFANQSRLLKTNLQQLAAKVMSSTLPAIAELAEKANAFISNIADSPEKIQRIQDAVKGMGDKIGEAIDFAVKLFSFISDNWNVIEPLIWGIVGAIVAWKVATMGMMIYQGIMATLGAATMLQSGATMSATIAQWGLNAAILANPMTWVIVGIIAAVVALIAIGVYLYRNWDEISAKAQALWVQVKSVFSGIGEAIGGAFKFGMNIAIGAINRIIRAVNSLSFNIPDWVPAIGGKQVGFKLPELPMFANGGFTNQASIFGEAGLEAAIPIKYKSPRSIGLLNQTAKAIGADSTASGMGMQFTYSPTINGGNASEIKRMLDEDKDKFMAMIEEWFMEKARGSLA